MSLLLKLSEDEQRRSDQTRIRRFGKACTFQNKKMYDSGYLQGFLDAKSEKSMNALMKLKHEKDQRKDTSLEAKAVKSANVPLK